MSDETTMTKLQSSASPSASRPIAAWASRTTRPIARGWSSPPRPAGSAITRSGRASITARPTAIARRRWWRVRRSRSPRRTAGSARRSALAPLAGHPMRLAEDLSVVDNLSGGRVEIGLGQGYRPAEFDDVRLELRTRTRAFEESLDILEKAWTGEPFDYDGKIYKVKGGVLRPPPVKPGSAAALDRRRRAQGPREGRAPPCRLPGRAADRAGASDAPASSPSTRRWRGRARAICRAP